MMALTRHVLSWSSTGVMSHSSSNVTLVSGYVEIHIYSTKGEWRRSMYKVCKGVLLNAEYPKVENVAQLQPERQ